MTKAAEFTPDWRRPPPSSTISDLLSKRGMSVADFDAVALLRATSLSDVLAGYRAIDQSMAEALEKHLGGSRGFWIRRERQYRESLAVEADQSLARYLQHILPIRDMVAYGWLRAFGRSDSDVDAAIRFFDVTSKEEFKGRYEDLASALSFRRSETFDLEVGALAAWMRAVELEASSISCSAWNRAGLREAVERIKPLTWEREPAQFLPKLRAICAEVGVAVTIVRAPRGCPVSGATKLLSPTKALIALSFRHLTDDHFWFSFFHEVGHLVLHKNEDTFVESTNMEVSRFEDEANRFASSVIVPDEHRKRFEELPANKYEIVRFSRAVGISPGLIVGQMQHGKMLRHNQMNRLKRRFAWTA